MTRAAFVGQQLETQLVGQTQPGHSITPDSLETRVNAEGEEAKTAAAVAASAAIAAAIADSEEAMEDYTDNAISEAIGDSEEAMEDYTDNAISAALEVFNGNVFITGATFDELTLTVGKVVYLDATPEWKLLDGTETFTDLTPKVGVIASLDPKKVQIEGIIENVAFDTPGNYYVNASGVPSTTPTNYILGVCLAAGVLLLGAQTTTFVEA